MIWYSSWSTLSDLRPISITPTLSRALKKLVTDQWLQSAITVRLTDDQFAFRQTGSTTCALDAYFTHHITRKLKTNSFVCCLLTDFSKVFDRVDNIVLISET